MPNFDPVNYSKYATRDVTIYGSILTLSGTVGTANITINGHANNTIATFAGGSLTATAATWVTNNYSYYYNLGYKVASAAGMIYVTPRYGWDTINNINVSIASVSGNLTGTLLGLCVVDFGEARNWNITFDQDIYMYPPKGSRDGEEVCVQFINSGVHTVTFLPYGWHFAGGTEPTITTSGIDIIKGVFNKGAARRIDVMTLAGSSGVLDIKAGGMTTRMLFTAPDVNATAVQYVAEYATYFADVGIILAATGGTSSPLLFTSLIDAAERFALPTVDTISGDLTAIVHSYVPGGVRVRSVVQDIKQ